jgi:hypothetical protein
MLFCEGCNKSYKTKGELSRHNASKRHLHQISHCASKRQKVIEEGDLFKVGEIFWGQCPGHPWWPCLLIGRLLTTATTPHSKMEGTKKMWLVWLLGGLEYAWVATDGLIAYSRLEEVPSFMSPEWKKAVNEANNLIKKSTKDKLNYLIKMVNMNKQNQSSSSSVSSSNGHRTSQNGFGVNYSNNCMIDGNGGNKSNKKRMSMQQPSSNSSTPSGTSSKTYFRIIAFKVLKEI